MKFFYRLCLRSLLLLIVFTNPNALLKAQKADSLHFEKERFSVQFGGFLTGLNSDLIVGSKQLGLGLSLNLEDALNLETTTTVLRGETSYDYGKRKKHRLGMSYFQLLRGASKTLDAEIEVGDRVFEAGTEIRSRFDLRIYKASYNYGFFQDDRMRLGASFGIFIMPISFSIETSRLEEEFFSFIAPFPVIGLSTDFNISPKLTLKQSFELLYVQFGDFRGVISDVNFRLEYKLIDHLALGTGINTFKLNIDLEADSDIRFDFVGAIQTGYTGVLFYVKYFINQ